MNKPVQALFRVGPTPPEGLFIRALPIYAEAGSFTQPVIRCPNHASPEDSTNREIRQVLITYWVINIEITFFLIPIVIEC